MKGPKAKEAMKFAAYLLEEASKNGKETAFELKTPFEEVPLLQTNKDFVFENMN